MLKKLFSTPAGLIAGAVVLAIIGIVLLTTANSGDDNNKAQPGQEGTNQSTPSETTTTTPTESSKTPTKTPTPKLEPTGIATPPDPKKVNLKDPREVGWAALKSLYSIRSDKDDGITDALARTKRWLAPNYTSAAKDTQGLADYVLLFEEKWEEYEARLYVNAIQESRETGMPEDTATQAYRIFIVNFTPQGKDDWLGATGSHTWYVTFTRASASHGWRINDLRFAS